MSIICRACLQNVDKSCYFYIDTFDNTQVQNTIPKDVLQLCVPEMDLYISDQPGVCGECLSMFESFYNFKNRCLASEERILTYLKKNRINPQSKINLKCVLYDVFEPSQEALKEHEIEIVPHFQSDTDVEVITLNRTAEPAKPDNELLLLSCNECSFVTMEGDKLRSHNCMRIAPAEKYKCPYCDYTSGRRYRMSYHVNAKHTKATWHDCNQCDYRTTDNGSLKRHQKVIHCLKEEGAPTFSCNFCDFHCMSEMALQRHRNSKHGPIIQYCNLCPYQTKDKSNFRKHLYVHSDKPRKCTKCSYQCVSPYQLQKHYKKTHI